MTVQIDGNDVIAIAQVVAWVAGIVVMLVMGLIIYLMVRPPRHVRQPRKAEPRPETAPIEAEELWRLVDRMEGRLEVLERALADQTGRRAIGANERDMILTPANDGRDSGRMG